MLSREPRKFLIIILRIARPLQKWKSFTPNESLSGHIQFQFQNSEKKIEYVLQLMLKEITHNCYVHV